MKKAKLVDQADADLLDTLVKKLESSCKNPDAFLLDIQGRRNNFKVKWE